MFKKALIGAGATALWLTASAGVATAQPPQQRGLVNVNISDVEAAIPVGIAANVCDLNVAVLVNLVDDLPANCDADVEQDVTFSQDPGGPAPNQEGLVNANISDLEITVPVGVVANICDVNVAVLVSDLEDGTADCQGGTVQDVNFG